MGNLSGFDANNVEPRLGFDALPVGRYPAIITETAFKPTKAGDGEYLQLTFEIIGDKFAGRLLWARLNMKNKNEEAVKIAQAELAAICKAVGVPKPEDSSALQNIPLQIDVKMEKSKEGEEPRNKIGGYHAAVGSAHSSAVVADTITKAAEGQRPAWASK